MSTFHLLLTSSRPAIHAFFAGLALPGYDALVVTPLPIAAGVLDAVSREVAEATVAVVDVAIDSAVAIQQCEELRARWPALPVLAVICCPWSLTLWQLQSLLAIGVTSLMDLDATPEQAAHALVRLARGEIVLHVQLRTGADFLASFLVQRAAAPNRATLDLFTGENVVLLTLLARGLSDREMGRHLHLSMHTVGSRIDRLREVIGAKNRTELAAWAGHNGFYASAVEETS